MKGRIRALGTWDGRAAAALIEDGRLEDLLLAPPPGVPQIGAVYRAKVTRQVARLGGQFVDLSPGVSGFLRGRSGAEPALVQVTSFAEPGKAVPVTDKVSLQGRYVVLTPGAPGVNVSRKVSDPTRREALRAVLSAALPGLDGAILRSSCADGSDEEIVAEAKALWDQMSALKDPALGLRLPGPSPEAQARVEWPGATEACFDDHDVAQMIEDLRAPQVALAGGASALIEPTRAFVAVDVNTGADTSPAAGLKANLALARDLPRQLRCRGLGGQVVIDAAPMPKKDRPRLDQALRQSFRAGPVDAELVGWTGLGHVELKVARRRVG